MSKKNRFLTNQLAFVLALTVLIMAALGALMYISMDRRINRITESNIANEAAAAASYYSENLRGEMLTLEHIGAILANEDTVGEDESLQKATVIIENVFNANPSIILGIMDGEKKPVYSEAVDPSDYQELLDSFRGNSGVSYMKTGALLFSYSVLRGDNVRYVLYYICSSTYIKRKHDLSMIKKLGSISLMTKDGDVIIPFSNVEKGDESFFASKSVNNVFNNLRRGHNLESVVVEKISTTKGDMFFYSAEVKNTPFVLAGAIDKPTAIGVLYLIPITVMSVYVIFVLIVLILSVFLIVASVKVRESDELREAKLIAEDASKAKGLFLANMSHEIRTPINAILGMDEMIIRQTGDKKLLQYAHSIKSSANSLLGLVNDILDFSAIEAGKLKLKNEPYNLSTLLMDISTLIKTRAESKNLEFKIDINKNVPDRLIGDVTRLKQVIINLLTNGVKYTIEGFVYLIIDYEKINDEEIKLKVSVKDSGIGMKPEDIQRLFHAFERFDENRNRTIEGTGLGMTIVKQLLDAMGGTIDVKSVYGEGSEFSFEVNQKVENWKQIDDYEITAEKAAIKQENYRPSFYAPDVRILSVDDMEINLIVVNGLLEQTGVKIDTALSGLKALELIKENRYDIMLIDHRMPEMDGMQLLERIRSMTDNENSSCVCIALTANVTEGMREKYITAGFNDYMEKPVKGNLLEEMLLKYIPKDKLLDESEREKLPLAPEENTGEEAEQGIPEAVKNELQRLQDEGLLDWTNAVEFAGSEELYLDTVLFFRDSIDEKADEIESLYFAENIQDFTTKVHALKSSARLVGLTELSEMARLLEEAGKNEDMNYIRDNTWEVLSKYRSYKDVLEKIKRE